MTERSKYGKQFGPESWQFDPYDSMPDDEFEREVVAPLMAQMRSITLRVPAERIDQAKRLAKERGMGYQVLMKRLVALGLDRLEADARREAS
ncbi:MAG: hypothetical protein ACREQM_09695 [Candidatus Dormibacteraceae bacterium]